MKAPPRSLADLRAEIDRLDAAMHAALLARSDVIAELIRVKGTQESGSAFRPAREAEVLRSVIARHRGLLPVDTVESIWRVIISTFTHVQAPHSVHADAAGGEAPIRDSARFHFGFTVPLVIHGTPAAVLAAVDASRGDLGLVRVAQAPEAGAWWRGLEGEGRPKIIARLPFVVRPNHPAGLPVYVVSKPVAEAAVRERLVASLIVEAWRPALDDLLAARGAAVVAMAGLETGLALLVEHAETLDATELRRALVDRGAGAVQYSLAGGHTAAVVPPAAASPLAAPSQEPRP